MESCDQSATRNMHISIKLEIEFLYHRYYHSVVESMCGIKQKWQGRTYRALALCWGSSWGMCAWNEKESVWQAREERQEVCLRLRPLLRISTCVRDKEEGKVTEGIVGGLCQLYSNWCHLGRRNLS